MIFQLSDGQRFKKNNSRAGGCMETAHSPVLLAEV